MNFFSSAFNGEAREDQELHSIMDILPSYVKEQHSKMLLRAMLMEEVKAVVFDMGDNKALGSNGFLALFF